MRRVRFRCVFGLCSVVAATTGCMQQYQSPTPSQPHATIEFRRKYAFHSDSSLYEQLVVDGTLTYEASDKGSSANESRTDSVLVRPGQHRLEVSVRFTRVVKQMMQELVNCGGYDGPTCRAPKSQDDQVLDAACHQQLGLDVQEGQLYLLQLDLHDANNCSVQCFVQTLTATGDLKNVPCPVVPMQD